MSFSHVFLTRPQSQSRELADMVESLGLQAVIQPAFSFSAVDVAEQQAEDLADLQTAGADDLVLFTSPRAVEHAMPQIPPGVLPRLRIAAIGPSTAKVLADRGIRVDVKPGRGYTSEDLLGPLAAEASPAGQRQAFIMAAPGGRKKLAKGLGKLGWDARILMVYRADPMPLDREALQRLQSAEGILSVWTSGNAMRALSQRLPPKVWFQVCQGRWLVISDRLKRLARAYGPAEVHLSGGPDNQAIFTAIRNLT